MRKKLVVLTAIVLSLIAGLSFAQSLSRTTASDPFEGVAPHKIPSCSPKGGENSAKCSCLGMVGRIQIFETELCNSGANLGPLELQSIDIAPIDLKTPLMRCLSEIPDHCEIVARYSLLWTPQFYKWESIHKFEYPCATVCKPERCGCADQPCKSHSNSKVY